MPRCSTAAKCFSWPSGVQPEPSACSMWYATAGGAASANLQTVGGDLMHKDCVEMHGVHNQLWVTPESVPILARQEREVAAGVHIELRKNGEIEERLRSIRHISDDRTGGPGIRRAMPWKPWCNRRLVLARFVPEIPDRVGQLPHLPTKQVAEALINGQGAADVGVVDAVSPLVTDWVRLAEGQSLLDSRHVIRKWELGVVAVGSPEGAIVDSGPWQGQTIAGASRTSMFVARTLIPRARRIPTFLAIICIIGMPPPGKSFLCSTAGTVSTRTDSIDWEGGQRRISIRGGRSAGGFHSTSKSSALDPRRLAFHASPSTNHCIRSTRCPPWSSFRLVATTLNWGRPSVSGKITSSKPAPGAEG